MDGHFPLLDEPVQLRSDKTKGPPLRELTSSSRFPFEVRQPELFYLKIKINKRTESLKSSLKASEKDTDGVSTSL